MYVCSFVCNYIYNFKDTAQPDLPFVFVGDEAFPLRNYMMRPFPGRNLPGKM